MISKIPIFFNQPSTRIGEREWSRTDMELILMETEVDNFPKLVCATQTADLRNITTPGMMNS